MLFASKPMPLEFWLRLQTRMEADFQNQRGRVPSLLQPVVATIETMTMVAEHADQARVEVFGAIQNLEGLQMLAMVLRGQLRRALFQAEVPDIEDHILCLRHIADLFEDFMTGKPRRALVVQELNAGAAQLASLRSAGNSESALAERQRLRAFSRELPILGAEDVADYESALRSMRSEIDQRESELQSVKSTTLMQLTVPDGLAAVLTRYGLEVFELPVPQIQPDAQVSG